MLIELRASATREGRQTRGPSRIGPTVSEPLMIRGRPPRSTAVALLQAQGLPVSDITGEHLEHFFFVGSDGLSSPRTPGTRVWDRHSSIMRSNTQHRKVFGRYTF